jgi:hypothetical protein
MRYGQCKSSIVFNSSLTLYSIQDWYGRSDLRGAPSRYYRRRTAFCLHSHRLFLNFGGCIRERRTVFCLQAAGTGFLRCGSLCRQPQAVSKLRRCIRERRTAFCLQAAASACLRCEVFTERYGSLAYEIREFFKKIRDFFQQSRAVSKLRRCIGGRRRTAFCLHSRRLFQTFGVVSGNGARLFACKQQAQPV